MILWNGTFLRFRAFKGEFLHCEDVRSLESKWSRSQQLTVERFNGKRGQVFKERSPKKEFHCGPHQKNFQNQLKIIWFKSLIGISNAHLNYIKLENNCNKSHAVRICFLQ